jgi:hypothetical protein
MHLPVIQSRQKAIVIDLRLVAAALAVASMAGATEIDDEGARLQRNSMKPCADYVAIVRDTAIEEDAFVHREHERASTRSLFSVSGTYASMDASLAICLPSRSRSIRSGSDIAVRTD